ncbi:MAG: hypothetical protein HRT88_15590 [Lentisphaeraceae bacterium]|nr:hypothetical protein [Lentisphaeraceae bacterium]
MTLNTDELRYHFFFDAPQRYIKQTLVHLQKAIKINPDNHRARALIGHQYFMMQQFNKANEIFAQSDYKQEDLHLFSKKFALLKTDDKKLLTISQLASLIDHINDNFDRRHHLCERLVVWDRLQRDNKYGYFPVIKELIASKNKGGQNYTFDFDLQSKKVKITGRGLTTLSEDTTIGSGRCLLRFLPIKTLDVSQTHFHNLWDIIALKDLETLDIRQTLVTRLEYLKELPKLKILILEKGQFSKRVLKWVPANVKIIYEKL